MTRVAEAAPVLLTPSSAFALCCDPTWSGGPPADGTARQPQLTVHWGVKFEWDPKKAAENLRKHGISFDEAATAFADWHSITVPDPEHSQGERRYYVLGMSDRGNLLVVCHTDRAEVTPTTSICERIAAGPHPRLACRTSISRVACAANMLLGTRPAPISFSCRQMSQRFFLTRLL